MGLFLLLALGLSAWAQAPRLGRIELYGLRKVSRERVLAAAGVRPGDALPASKGDLEDRVEKVPGVVLAHAEVQCCDDSGGAVLFIGVEEKGAPHFALRSPPAGDVTLPESLVNDYNGYLVAVRDAAARGSTGEDLTQGHSLMTDPAARRFAEGFREFAAANQKLLADCLRACSDAEQRAIAATVIGYAPDKKSILDDLQYAMQDPDEAVRASAVRALSAIAVLAARRPELEIHIPATWFIEMLNSVFVSDRLQAAEALVSLTDRNGAAVLQQFRERALPAILEMARWDALRYALPAFILAGRMAGLPEDRIREAWSQNHREAVLQELAQPRPKR